ncbi:restriction endonuclease subunit S [Pseudomonas aeruginosa]|uniref:restriction endonuclease subunit S n=1 Tax=Pseudomonas aeruginosa TaxID=287 RepID=UPI00053D73A2|nr:restriction endonuclease subunit S [Pseudomonas aeruginosa]MBI8522552.1 restriction endonuclease subunit S [Pseudomonas aeruginosa]OPE13623.1 restriction endonuclease subunit S [Pseudomonas aeruginosa]HCE7982581.1 restriction endonuclease subunit S [Pseudomonas aeruginosa]HEI9897660.1 restriction endonuclease subunit S [Pseudomonas aeruginosa]
MTALLTDNLPLLAGAPNGIKKLRELILELAVRGKLVPQDPNDEPASELLKRIAEEKARLVAEGKIKKQKPLAGIEEEEKPFELPNGWVWRRFGEVFSLEYGDNLPADKRSNTGEYPVYGSNGVVGTHSTCFVDSPCIVVGRKGSAGALNLCLSRGCCVTDVAYYCIPPSAFSLDYAFKLFHTLGLDSLGKGIKPGLNRNEVYELVVAAPPIAEQHRIVAKVDKLMALCDRLEARQADADSAHAQLVQALLGSLTQASDAADFAQSWQRLAEHFHTLFTTESSIDALKQALLQLAVMGKLVPQDPSDEPASELLKRIAEEKATLIAEGKIRKQKQLAEITEEEKLFELATGWEWSRLGEQVIESGAGWSPSCEPRPREGNDWGVLKVSAVSWGVYRPEENKALPVSLEARPEHEVAEGDFLVSRANTAELVARSVVVDSTPSRLMLSDKIVRLRLTKLCDAHYLNLVNSATHARQYYARVAGGTSSSMKNVSREQILSLPIAVPPLPEQHRIVAKVDQLMAFCDQLKARLHQARQVHEQLANALVEQAVA